MGKMGRVGFMYDFESGCPSDGCKMSTPIASSRTVMILLSSGQPLPADVTARAEPQDMFLPPKLMRYDASPQSPDVAAIILTNIPGRPSGVGRLMLVHPDGTVYDEVEVAVAPIASYTAEIEDDGRRVKPDGNTYRLSLAKRGYSLVVRLLAADGTQLMSLNSATASVPVAAQGSAIVDLEARHLVRLFGQQCDDDVGVPCRQATDIVIFIKLLAAGEVDLLVRTPPDRQKTLHLIVQ
jgi:hypothetical protein